ncbi:MAG: hypothetical protein WAV72_24850 [Bradyrhizobium sp.]
MIFGDAGIEILAQSVCGTDSADLGAWIADLESNLSRDDFRRVMARAAEILDGKPSAIDQLCAYFESDLFKIRCAEVRARQDRGEDFDVPQLAEALGVPLDLATLWMQQRAEKVLARLVVPEKATLQ